MIGTVRKYDGEKGFGWIRPDDRSLDDVFFHVKEFKKGFPGVKPEREIRISFDVETCDRGRRAVSISRA